MAAGGKYFGDTCGFQAVLYHTESGAQTSAPGTYHHDIIVVINNIVSGRVGRHDRSAFERNDENGDDARHGQSDARKFCSNDAHRAGGMVGYIILNYNLQAQLSRNKIITVA
jgi:hypothetical protein